MNKFKVLLHQRLALLWTVFILILCTMKMPDSIGESGFFFTGFDKMVHLGFFFVLTILLFYGETKSQRRENFGILTIFKILMLTFALGGFIELIQLKFFTYRSAEWWDLGSDMIGVFMAIFAYVLLNKSNYEKES
ncbi:VanZ family protein [Pedobacter cryoconitis]|uniref:VanZ family protein n=1 Tax=Pedobacter cryoconitis TaxID=188932 RepID=A0A7W8YYV1_9SPHI|nr:VanZ family protein [Pedobacter cryoconitis]MBB5624182.1 VanZ family protein [Pedobacter cryoconitis]